MSPALVQLLIGIAIPLIPWAVRELQTWQAKKVQSKALNAIEDAAASAGVAALKAGANQQAATAAAKSALMAALPNVADATEADVDVLLAGHVAQLATTPGGATVTLPKPT